MAIRQRNYEIVIIIGLLLIFEFCIDRPLALIDDANVFIHLINTESFNVLHTIHFFLFPLQIHGLKLALLWRYFSIYFDINFVHCLRSSEWKSIISTKFKQENWFLAHKETIGNISWQFKKFLICWLFISIFAIIICNLYQFNIYSETFASILHGIIIFLYAPILIFIYHKIPNIQNDIFYIKKEMRYILQVFIFQFLIYFISISCQQLMNLDNFIVEYFWSVIGMISASLYLYFLTIFILQKTCWNHKSSDLQEKLYLNAVHSLSSNASSNRSNHSNSLPKLRANTSTDNNYSEAIIKSKQKTIIDLFFVLRDEQGFQVFINHLVDEMSQETLLSFIEMVQWKTSFNNKLKDHIHIYALPCYTNTDDGNDKTTKDILLFKFPNCVPMSSIVEQKHEQNDDENDDDDEEKEMTPVVTNDVNGANDGDYDDEKFIMKQFKISAYKLFKKYIYTASSMRPPYEINICYTMRDPLIALMKDYNQWIDNNSIDKRELFCIFDECIIEMFDLMNVSFNERFKSGEQFAQFVQLLQTIDD